MYPFLDLITLTTVSVGVLLIGAAGIILLKKPMDKVIMFALLQGGFIGLIVSANTSTLQWQQLYSIQYQLL